MWSAETAAREAQKEFNDHPNMPEIHARIISTYLQIAFDAGRNAPRDDPPLVRLLLSLFNFIETEDIGVPRQEFLRRVAERIKEGRYP